MKGGWNQLTENPLIKLMVLASTFYMLCTLEGPIQAVKSVNAIAHFTDWIPGHVHDGVLGWVAFMAFAAVMHMAPRVFKREIYSKSTTRRTILATNCCYRIVFRIYVDCRYHSRYDVESC